MFNLNNTGGKMTKEKDAIFYIKYFALKYGETIERKGQLDDVAKGEYISKKGHPCFNYLDIWATEKFGSPQYRTASYSWEFNEQPTIEINHIKSVIK